MLYYSLKTIITEKNRKYILIFSGLCWRIVQKNRLYIILYYVDGWKRNPKTRKKAVIT